MDSARNFRVFRLNPTEEVVDQGDVLDRVWTPVQEQFPYAPVAVPWAFMDGCQARGICAVGVEYFIAALTNYHVRLIM